MCENKILIVVKYNSVHRRKTEKYIIKIEIERKNTKQKYHTVETVPKSNRKIVEVKSTP